MSKQDRQGVRTPADFERKHGKVLSGKDDTNASQDRQLEQMAQAMAGNTSAFNYSITQINARLSRVEQAIADLEGDDTDTTLLARIEAVESANETQDQTIAATSQAVNSLLQTVTDLSGRMSAVESTLTSLVERVTALEGKE